MTSVEQKATDWTNMHRMQWQYNRIQCNEFMIIIYTNRSNTNAFIANVFCKNYNFDDKTPEIDFLDLSCWMNGVH